MLHNTLECCMRAKDTLWWLSGVSTECYVHIGWGRGSGGIRGSDSAPPGGRVQGAEKN